MSEYEQVSCSLQVLLLVVGTITVVVYYRQLRATQRQIIAMDAQMAFATKTQQTSQYQSALQLMFSWRSEAIANPDLIKYFHEDPYFGDVFSLVREDQYFHIVKLFHIFELYWLLKSRDVIDDQMWKGWLSNTTLLMRLDTNRQIWTRLRTAGIFHPEFVNLLDALVRGDAGTS